MPAKPKSTRRQPKSAKRTARRFPRLTRARVLGLAAAALVLAVGSYGLAAARTVSDYQQRLASGSFAFSGDLTFQGQDFLSPLNSDMNFSGRYAGGTKPSVSTTFLGTWAGREYSGDAQLAGGELYFNLSGPDMPTIRYRQGSFLLPLQAGQWYSARADESLYDNLCAHAKPASLQGKLELYRTIKSLQIVPSPLVNFWTRLQDFDATRVSGTLSGAQLAKLWDAVQKAAPPGCSDPNTLGITADDLKHVTTQVVLVASHKDGPDLLTITLTDKTLGATAKITFLTSNYGQTQPLPTPSGATDLNALYAHAGLR